MSGIVTLTTDFGTADGYAGAVKGVILSIAPDSRVVDLSHDVPAGDVAAGAWCLRVAAPTFPSGTVHLAVVDPGVGGGRRPVIVSRGGHLFVGPDNGLLSLARGEVDAAWTIEPDRVRVRDRVAPTFHGRDVFAPAAARLASGAAAQDFAVRMQVSALESLPLDLGWSEEGGVAVGRVVHVDRFGNLVTSLPADLLVRSCAAGGSADGRPVLAAVACYEAIPDGGVAFIEGSQGLVEISLRDGSAAKSLGLGVGAEVKIITSPGGGQ
ncbi:MAG: SAM-dependent chlorinase/fluorinase [Deltaproteobacteria bacterium]|nr:SAM-dependent chlorinase/fluorinase [Deltaproteobacteria bacterium]